MNRMYNLIVLPSMVAVLSLLASCTSEDTVDSTPANSLKLNVFLRSGDQSSAKSQTRGSYTYTPSVATKYSYYGNDNPSYFAGNTSLGIFLRQKAGNDLYLFSTIDPNTKVKTTSGPYDNIQYVSSGTYPNQQWTANNNNTSVLLSDSIDGQVCAYYPFHTNYTFDGNLYQSDRTYNTGYTSVQKLPIDCTVGQDYMYSKLSAASNGNALNGQNPVVSLHMLHAQAILKFTVSVPSDYSGNVSLTQFTVVGGFAMQGSLNITDGSYTVDMSPSGADTLVYKGQASGILATLSTSQSYTTSTFVLPKSESSATSLSVVAHIGGHDYTATISGLTLLRGYYYTIPLLLTNENLIVSQVDIEPWAYTSVPTQPLIPSTAKKQDNGTYVFE